KSKTHKGNGFNELRFEDEKDREEVFIHAQKDQNNVVNHDETTQIGNDRTEQVGHDETINIGNNRTESVGVDESITIGQDQNLHVNRNRITKIEKDDVLNIGNHFSLDVYADQTIHSGRNHSHTISKNVSIKVGKELKQHSQQVRIIGSTNVKVMGKAGTMLIDGSGIMLKGKVTIKGNLSIIGGSPEAPQVISLSANNGQEICQVCEAMKNKE
ncbi:bacteriophage T4 gp5 trimerisation domain-containing protein, partial [Actinobacillus vicugnae]|uniref:bacteriophage T4 gp5 trimerisation domain-containing protein n=1 Tax=Actinobacillus vicugnae TaxID=2573093 RepID=UPI003CC7E409